LANQGFRTLVKTVTKKVITEAEAGNKEQALVELKRAQKVIAKVGGKGILHSRAASRKISSLTRLVNRAS
jgi:small subunit ribosomal protein S20